MNSVPLIFTPNCDSIVSFKGTIVCHFQWLTESCGRNDSKANGAIKLSLTKWIMTDQLSVVCLTICIRNNKRISGAR